MPKVIITELSKGYVYRNKISQGWLWAYMGKNVCQREKIDFVLGEDSRYLYADELKDMSCQYKQDFLDWVVIVGKRFSKPIFWWTTRLASKSTLQTDFYLLFCYLVLLKRWSKQGDRKLIVFIEDGFLLKTAKDNLKSGRIFFDVSKYFYFKQYFYLTIQAILIPFYFLVIYTIFYLLNWIFKRRYKKQPLDGIDILIHTWVEDRSFKNSKEFYDFYFKNLYSAYRNHEYKTATLAQLNLGRKLLSKSYQFDTILPLAYFMSFKAVVKTFFVNMDLYSDNQPLFGGFNLRFLLKGEVLKEKASPAARIYYLQYQTYKEFSKATAHTHLKGIIYLFENQPWEKVMLLAFKEEGVSFKAVGYQSSSIPSLLLTYDLGKDELGDLPLPPAIVANTSYNERYLKKAGFPNVSNGGNLRYSSRELSKQISIDGILLLCSVSMEHTLALIHYGLRKLSKTARPIIIKLHPDISKRRAKRYLGKITDHLCFIDGNLADLQSKFDTVIHTGTTAALECMVAEKKVYKLKTELLDIDPLDSLIRQNEIDEKTDLNLYQYNPCSSSVTFLYEDVKTSIWLNIFQEKKLNEQK